jgi:uroporphyrinogen III methyltransferase/synthase
MAEAVAQALARHEPGRVLIPRARIARDVLPAELRARGAEVDVVEVYRTDAPMHGAERLRELLPQTDVVTFTSSSTVTNFVRLAGRVPDDVKVACIGPITAQTAREQGLRVDVVAEEYTTEGLLRALIAYCSASTSTSRKRIRS